MRCETTYISPEEAVRLLFQRVKPPVDRETAALPDTSGRVLAEDLYAALDQPPFDRSPLDGYAVQARDTADAGEAHPVSLRVVDDLPAGTPPGRAVGPGEAARIMTGAPVPPGADCVVRQEDTDCGKETVRIYVPHRAGQNICRKGEDFQAGRLLLQKGEALNAVRIGTLASMGKTEVSVFRRPRIGILTTGDELVDLGGRLAPGKIYNSNQYTLAARVRELGGEAMVSPPCPDRVEKLAAAVDRAAAPADLLITTGGVSVGERDCMPEVQERLRGQPVFKGIQIKPGAPAMAFVHRETLVLCLSGNPFAAAATFELLARPLFPLLRGERDCTPSLPRASGVLRNCFPKASPGRRFIRGFWDGRNVFLPHKNEAGHSSGVLSSMMRCNCLVDIPAGSPPLPEGTPVEVVLL